MLQFGKNEKKHLKLERLTRDQSLLLKIVTARFRDMFNLHGDFAGDVWAPTILWFYSETLDGNFLKKLGVLLLQKVVLNTEIFSLGP
jgi:hypothetical protein